MQCSVFINKKTEKQKKKRKRGQVAGKVQKIKDWKGSEQEGTLKLQEAEVPRAALTDTISEDILCDLAELFKVFGDSSRIKILYDLFSGEKNVTEICRDLEMNQSAVSHQLKILRTAKLVQGRREGKSIVYALADEHVKMIIAMGIEHTEE